VTWAKVVRQAILLGTIACSIISCHRVTSRFDSSRFDVEAALTLCFDLDDTTAPLPTGIVLRLPEEARGKQSSIVLPFSTKEVEPNAEGLLTWGSLNDLTAITYVPTASSSMRLAVGLSPEYSLFSEEADFDRSEFRGALVLVSSGLKRRLVFDPSVRAAGVPGEITQALNPLALGEVAVRLPGDAEIFETRSGALPHNREKIVRGSLVRFYRNPAPQSSGTLQRLDIRYQVQPTSAQKTLFEYGLKLFVYLVAPLVGLILLTSNKVASAKGRRILIIIMAVVECVLLGGLLVWAFYIRSVTGLQSLLEVVLAAAGTVVTVLVAFVKGEANGA